MNEAIGVIFIVAGVGLPMLTHRRAARPAAGSPAPADDEGWMLAAGLALLLAGLAALSVEPGGALLALLVTSASLAASLTVAGHLVAHDGERQAP